MSKAAGWLADLGQEFSGAKLADTRLERRVSMVMRALAARPDRSFPDAMETDSALEGLYRLLNNPRVNHQEMFEAHAQQAAERARNAGQVLVLHDTSTFKLPHSSVDEVGETTTGVAGFFGHVSLVLDAQAERCPLGVIALSTIHRDPQRPRHDLSGPDCAKLDNKESARWLEGVKQAELRLGPTTRAVHVMDREGDSYVLYAGLQLRGSRFVIRADDRACLFEGEKTKIREALSKQRIIAERDVPLPRRKGRTSAPRSVRAVREARLAKLAITGCTVTLLRANYLSDPIPRRVVLNAVRVFEIDPPQGQEPIEWFLLTTEPIETDEQLLRVVDIYRCRWVIEELFKALKTGCIYQERELEDREALLLALVFFLPIACQLLWLRSCSRSSPDASAEGLVNDVQMRVIRHFSSRKLPAAPTMRELVWAIAAIGGHLKNNGEPGWQVLARAWQQILQLEHGWRAAMEHSIKL
jgi:hypothetical protein